MKIFLVSLIVLVATNAYKVEKITGIDGNVRQIEFDPYENTYLITVQDETYSLVKLDRHNNIIFTIGLPAPGLIIINSKGNVYCMIDTEEGMRLIYLLKANTDQLEILLEYSPNPHDCDTWDFMDKDDNLYVSHEMGVAILKSGQNFLTAITNLNNFSMCQHYEDGEGNSYFTSMSQNQVFVLTTEAKKLAVPYAQLVSGFENDPFITLTRGYDNKVFTMFTRNSIFEIRKLVGNSSELLYSRYRGTEYGRFASLERFFIIGDEFDTSTNYIYIFSSDGKVVRSENNIDIEKDTNAPIPVWRDTAYFPFRKEIPNSDTNILFIRNDDYKIRYLNFTFSGVSQIAADSDNNLWVMTYDGLLYVYLKNTDEVVQVFRLPLSRFPEQVLPHLKYKGFGYLFIGTKDGLYICSDD